MKRLFVVVVTIALTFTSLPVSAATSYVDSVGSSNMEDNGTTIGVDTNQTEKTTYSDDLSNEGSQSSEVYVTQASSFGVFIPKTIILSGNTNNGAYVIKTQGDIAGKETINVVPEESLLLSQYGKNDITANIVQDKKVWNCGELDILKKPC